MTAILALETSTEACSAALLLEDQDGQNIISRFERAPRAHTKLILPMLEDVLQEASLKLKQIDALAFGRGPGAFTGLRIAAGVAQGLALSVDKPVIPVSTLAALALQAIEHKNKRYNDNSEQHIPEQHIPEQHIIAALDARMGEVYWGHYIDQALQGEERISKPRNMLDKAAQNTLAIGSGWDAYRDELTRDDVLLIENELPSAASIAQLALDLYRQGESVDAAFAQPVYIRDKVAEKSGK